MKQLVEHYSESPYIRFGSVDVIYKALGRHIDWRPNIDIFPFLSRFTKRVLGELGKSEVSNLCFSIVHENVSDFKIPMYDIHIREVQKPFKHISHYALGLCFSESVLFAQYAFEITLIAQFSDYITVSIAGKNLIAF